MPSVTNCLVENSAAANPAKYKDVAKTAVTWPIGSGRSGWFTVSRSKSSRSLAIKVHMQMKSNGMALRTLSARSVVLTYKGRKITRKPSSEESSLVSRTIARRVCKIIPSYSNFRLVIPVTRLSKGQYARNARLVEVQPSV